VQQATCCIAQRPIKLYNEFVCAICSARTNPDNHEPLETVVITDAKFLGGPAAQKTGLSNSQGPAKK
jgi:hypothetical protein